MVAQTMPDIFSEASSLEKIGDLLGRQDVLAVFGGEAGLQQIIDNVAARNEAFARTKGEYLSLKNSPRAIAREFTRIHIQDYRHVARPSVPALVAHCLDVLQIDPDSPHYRAAMLVAFRTEREENNGPRFHNINHYEDVIAHTTIFHLKNRELAAQGVAGAPRLTPEEDAEALIAAILHDLDHPGGKNALPGETTPTDIYRLERRSFAITEPLLRMAGLSDKSIGNIQTIVFSTSPNGPINVLKSVMKAHAAAGVIDWSTIDPNGKFSELKPLCDLRLAARAGMVEDADLGESAFEGMDASDVACADLTAEVQECGYTIPSGPNAGQPEDLRGPFARACFGKFIVGTGPCSAAAQAALGKNYLDMMQENQREIAILQPT